MTIPTNKQIEIVLKTIGEYVSIPSDKLTFEQYYGGCCWHTENKTDFYCFVMCVTHKYVTEWVVLSDDPSKWRTVEHYFSVKFSV